jgi:radical SAM superfamily enzyme YgiQ (UPF0313 family)
MGGHFNSIRDTLHQYPELDRPGCIAVFSKKRTDIDPIIIAGGHALSTRSHEPFIDVFVIGDGEDIF